MCVYVLPWFTLLFYFIVIIFDTDTTPKIQQRAHMPGRHAGHFDVMREISCAHTY